ncbi:hypothetical protein P3342_002776, partial [Pyrenophora teres f. teres]
MHYMYLLLSLIGTASACTYGTAYGGYCDRVGPGKYVVPDKWQERPEVSLSAQRACTALEAGRVQLSSLALLYRQPCRPTHMNSPVNNEAREYFIS